MKLFIEEAKLKGYYKIHTILFATLHRLSIIEILRKDYIMSTELPKF